MLKFAKILVVRASRLLKNEKWASWVIFWLSTIEKVFETKMGNFAGAAARRKIVIITYIYSPENNHRYRVQVHRTDLADAMDRTGQHEPIEEYPGIIESTTHRKCVRSVKSHRDPSLFAGMVLKAVQYWKAHDKKILVDFNEAFDLLFHRKCHFFWMKGNSLPNV